MKVFVFVVLATVFGVATAVQDLERCPDKSKLPSGDDIKIGGCDKPPCVLKRRTTVETSYRFKPEVDIKSCENKVLGIIATIPLPFLGVDGTDCCPNMYNTEGEKVGCPLKAGVEYEYRNEINVLSVYPKVSVKVHWQLINAANKRNILCFEVPAKITS